MTETNTVLTPVRAVPTAAPALAFNQVVGLARMIDAIAMLAPGFVIYLWYVALPQGGINSQYVVSIAAAVFVALLSLDWFGTYREAHFFGRRFAINRVIGALGLSASILLAIVFALKITDFYSRVWAMLWMISSIATVTLGRAIFRSWIHRLADAGRFAARTAIVGSGRRAQELSRHFGNDCRRSIRVVQLFDDRDGDSGTGGENLSDLVALIRRGLVDQVVLAIPWQERDRLRTVVNTLALTPVDIRLSPEILAPEFRGRPYVEVAGMPMLGMFDRPISGWGQIVKAVEDRLLSFLFLILLAPVMALIALAIRADSPGPILFRQIRQGFNNRSIEVLKFRTMFADMTDAECTVQATRDDERVTPVGRFLRRWSLDELPQLINVLLGTMSIVGPRPHAPATKAAGQPFEDVVERYAARHKVKPGITGWAQVNGWRGETDTVEKAQKRVEYDLDYIDNWSIWFDLLIIAKTLWVLFRNTDNY
jgi:Undecaprenyl-phosphate glucose phosphotransferase